MHHLLALIATVFAIVAVTSLILSLDRSVPAGIVGLRDRLHFVSLMSRLSEAGAIHLANKDDVTKAAALLSIEADEVYDVLDSEAGLLVKTVDGNTYIIVEDTNPDADGKYGVMFLVAPTPKYGGNFPVYAQPGAVDALSAVAGAPSFADLRELEDTIVDDLTGDELAEPPLRADDPELPPKTPPHPGVEDATAAALRADQGPPSEPVPAPGPGQAEDVVDATTPAGKQAVEEAADKAGDAGDPVPADKAADAKAATEPPAKRTRRN